MICDLDDLSPLTMDCGEHLIKVTYSNYGRTKPYAMVCPHPRGFMEDVACTSTIADQLVHCDGLTRCLVNVNKPDDPCYGTGKYTEVQYICLGKWWCDFLIVCNAMFCLWLSRWEIFCLWHFLNTYWNCQIFIHTYNILVFRFVYNVRWLYICAWCVWLLFVYGYWV